VHYIRCKEQNELRNCWIPRSLDSGAHAGDNLFLSFFLKLFQVVLQKKLLPTYINRSVYTYEMLAMECIDLFRSLFNWIFQLAPQILFPLLISAGSRLVYWLCSQMPPQSAIQLLFFLIISPSTGSRRGALTQW
jgi:hypothetical protein